MRMRRATVDELVAEWLRGDGYTMIDALLGPFADPEAAWEAILRILEHDLSEKQLASIAAGPIEDLLVLHGAQFIDRIVDEAERDSRFAHILGGVWQRNIPHAIWQRVEAARKGRVW